jgi:hypothetical protein
MPEIKRIDRYTITIDGVTIRATQDQVNRITQLTPKQLDRFVKIMGGADRG